MTDEPPSATGRPTIEPGPTTELPGGIVEVDTRTAALTNVTAGYLFRAPRPTLLECGPALTIDAVIGALASLGMDPDDLAYLVVTHIHLDHAGGAGALLTAFPNAKVLVSERGARHLVDPERLNASSRQVYGPLMDAVYGDCSPIDDQRVVAVGEGDSLDLGAGRRLDFLYTPGHAKHHVSAVDSTTGAMFVGDSVGVKVPGMRVIRPATPPPDFDLVLAQRTLRRYTEISPERLYLAHYGDVGDVGHALEEAQEQLARWFATAEAAWRHSSELDHVAETLAARFASDVEDGAHADDAEAEEGDETHPAGRDAHDDATTPRPNRRVDLLSGYRANAAGLVRYLELRADGRVAT